MLAESDYQIVRFDMRAVSDVTIVGRGRRSQSTRVLSCADSSARLAARRDHLRGQRGADPLIFRPFQSSDHYVFDYRRRDKTVNTKPPYPGGV